MGSPFPGMDPYLEDPSLWESVHPWLICVLAERIGMVLPDPYWVAIERRTYRVDDDEMVLLGVPDAEVLHPRVTARRGAVAVAADREGVAVRLPVPDVCREGYLEVRDPRGGEVVCVVEVLSPTNKRPGRGRREYLAKREAILDSETHLVEIDLLRSGFRMPVEDAPVAYDYGVLVSRAPERPGARLLAITLRDPLPRFSLPLRDGDAEPEVELGEVLRLVYDRGRFDRGIDYRIEPNPPLQGEAAAWAAALLGENRTL